MDLRDRFFGPIHSVQEDLETIDVDFGDLVRKLVLSEEVVIQSNRLAEFPLLVRKFGYDGVKELLKSKRCRVHCDALTIGQTGQTTALQSRAKKGALPLGSYCFDVVRVADRRALVHDGLQAINEVPGLTARQSKKLRKLIASSLVDPGDDAGVQGSAQLATDLAANSPILKTSVALAVRRQFDRVVAPQDIELTVEPIDDTDWRTESNIGQLVGLEPEEAHKVVGQGLLGVGGLNLRIEAMQRYEAVTGFGNDDLPLMEAKLSFLARQLDPDVQAERFERVVELVGLPGADPDPSVHDVDLARLLEVVADDEAREFRRWLRGVDALDDKAVEAEIHKIRDVVSRAVHSDFGRTARFLGTTGLSVVEPVSGTIAGALDHFLVDKIVPEPGPTAFLSRLYPSVFQQAS
jgi:hypothetical protein